MKRQVKVTEPAQEDLQAIWSYVSQFDREAADKLIKGIAGRFATLRDHPYIGRPQDDLLLNMRCLVFKDYLIFYQPFDDRIEVLRVLRGSRDVEGEFKKFFDSLQSSVEP